MSPTKVYTDFAQPSDRWCEAEEADAAVKIPAAKRAWADKLAAKLAILASPGCPYRIIQDAMSGTYRVQKWELVQSRPWSLHTSLLWDWNYKAQELRYYGYEPAASIQWGDFGSANPFPSFEAAEKWLQAWLNPIAAEVFYDAQGKRQKP